MGAYIMNFQITRQDLIKGVQAEFNETYPFLKIVFTKGRGNPHEEKPPIANGMSATGNGIEKDILASARKLLWEQFSLSDDMKVSELEILLQYQFGLPVQILRKSGNLWMETRASGDWTLRQQNNHGEEIARQV